MTYKIDRFRSNSFNTGWPINLADETVNNSHGINLIGRGVTNYGELMAENFVYLLENFAGTVAPPNPVTGQLWYNANPASPGAGTLNIFNGVVWQPIGGIPIGTTLPPTGKDGDLFYQVLTEKNQLYGYGGAKWNRIGGMVSTPTTPSTPNNGDIWFDTSLANNTSLAPNNKQRLIKIAISGTWYPIALGDPSGGAANNTSLFTIGNTIVFKSNGTIMGAWSNTDQVTAPSEIASVFPNGLKIGLNLSNVANNKLVNPVTNSELLLAPSVRIDESLNVDVNATIGGFIAESVSDSIAAAGNSQATAIGLGRKHNFITSVTPGTADGVRLPDTVVMPIGASINIWNLDATDTLRIYPNSGSSINGGVVNASIDLGPDSSITIVRRTATNFRTITAIYG